MPSNVPIPDEGGWISGHMADPPPEFNPAAVVFEIMDVLARAGVTINPGPNMIYTASIAAGDLLRALGVRPVTAPERR